MKKEQVTVKAGFTGAEGEPARDEIREAGFEVVESSAEGKYYASQSLEVEVPETLDELLELEEQETVLGWCISKYKTTRIYDKVRRNMESKLKKEVPAECKTLMEGLVMLGVASKEELDNLPFEQKSDLDYLKSLAIG